MTHVRGFVHPEHLAREEADARALGRFVVAFGERVPLGKPRPERRLRATFDALMAPLLGPAKQALAFTSRGRLPAGLDRFPAGYLTSQRGRVSVNLDAPGIRTDLSFWWALLESPDGIPYFTTPLEVAEQSGFLARVEQIFYQTFKYELSSSAITLCKQLVRDGVVIGLSPYVDDWQRVCFRLFASPGLAPRVMRSLLEYRAGRLPEGTHPLSAYHAPEDQIVSWADKLRSVLAMGEISGREPEPRLVKWLKRPGTDGAVESWRQAVGAAMLVAYIERRGPPSFGGRGEGEDNVDTRAWILEWAATQDRLEAKTVELAAAVAAGVSAENVAGPEVLTEEGRRIDAAAFREEARDLVARLEAARVTRRVQFTAANARPIPVSPALPEDLASPLRWRRMAFYALRQDARDLIAFAVGETEARIAASSGDGGIIELGSLFEVDESLDSAFDGALDERTVESHQAKFRGLKFRLWWPDVSPPPLVRDRAPPKAHGGDELLEQLRIEPAAPPRPLEVVGWGWVELYIRGGLVQEVTRLEGPDTDRLILQSSLTWPTGTEITRPRYRGEGPWREVDWMALRRKVGQLRAHLLGPLGAARLDQTERVPILRAAHARLTEGWSLADDYCSRWFRARVVPL